MVGPCGIAEVNSGFVGVELGEKESTQVNGTGARDGLNGGCTLFREGWGIGSQNELRSCGCEWGKSGDREVFVI